MFNDKIILITADNEIYKAKDVESLMLDNLGWSVPLDGMKYWIRGIPDLENTIDSYELNNKAQLVRLKQSGWDIRFSHYRQVDQYTLPGKIILTNPKAKITILAKEWTSVS